ncbi:hypothetical protein Tco_1027702, partial [Tanacetum coccineum]
MLSLPCAATKLASVVIALYTLSPLPYGQPHLLHGMEVGVFAQCELQFKVHGKLLEVFQFKVIQCEVLKHLVVSVEVMLVWGSRVLQNLILISMFNARHELYFLELVSDMKASSKSKPTGRTFTLVGNACPLTRVTATNKVPLREPIPLEVVTQESVVTKVYTRRPKVPKTNGSNSKPKIAKSVISNKAEPGTSRGSNNSVASSYSSVDLRLSKLFCGIWSPDAQST